MNKQEKIDFIYETIADKDLSYWCKLKFSKWIYKTDFEQNDSIDSIYWMPSVLHLYTEEIQYFVSYNDDCYKFFKTDCEPKVEVDSEGIDFDIIWHPVMLGDVLDYLWDKKWLMTIDRIIRHWKKKRLPIEDQDDGFIDYIYRTLQ